MPGTGARQHKSSHDVFHEAAQRTEERAQEERIGLFGTRQDAGPEASRASRMRRMREIFGVARRHGILEGLTPSSLRSMLEELGPTFVKAGQILSMRSEVLPESFCQELSKLRSDAEPMSYDDVLATLRAEYHRPLEQLFDAIDPVPLGSASIAQVHKARLADGTDVAVKVERPHVRETMAQDIQIMRSVARHAKVFMHGDSFIDFNSVIDELWETFREETDFLQEARNLEEFRQNNADVRYVGCPRPFMRLCTAHVVVMEFVEGIPIARPHEVEAEGYDLEDIGTKLVENYMRQILDDGFFHADPHPGNILISDGKIVFIDLGMMGRLSAYHRSGLHDIVIAVAEHDSPKLERGLLHFSVNTDESDIDHSQLLADLDRIVDDYGSTNLSELDLGQFISAIVTLARKNGIELSGSITTLARCMVTLEGVLDEFLPGTSMVEIIRDHAKGHLDLEEQLKHDAERAARLSRSATKGILEASSQLGLLSEMLTRGQLKVNLDFVGSEDPVEDLSHLADRLTVGIITAGLLIASAVLVYARAEPHAWGVSLFGVVGYLFAFALAIWVVRDVIAQSRRRPRR